MDSQSRRKKTWKPEELPQNKLGRHDPRESWVAGGVCVYRAPQETGAASTEKCLCVFLRCHRDVSVHPLPQSHEISPTQTLDGDQLHGLGARALDLRECAIGPAFSDFDLNLSS